MNYKKLIRKVYNNYISKKDKIDLCVSKDVSVDDAELVVIKFF